MEREIGGAKLDHALQSQVDRHAAGTAKMLETTTKHALPRTPPKPVVDCMLCSFGAEYANVAGGGLATLSGVFTVASAEGLAGISIATVSSPFFGLMTPFVDEGLGSMW